MQYLLINQSTPFSSNAAQGAIDLAIALSTFEQTVQLLFIGTGVLQLLKHQQPRNIYRKDFITTFKALELYDVTDIYVDYTSMQNSMLSADDLIIAVTIIDAKKIAHLMATADIVLNMG